MQLSFQIGGMLALGRMLFFVQASLKKSPFATVLGSGQKKIFEICMYTLFSRKRRLPKKSENCEKNILKIDVDGAENDIWKCDIDKN